MKRREFLAAGVGVVLAPAVATFGARAAAPAPDYRRLLILVELKGGNDGLNTVVPYADPHYAALRPRIGIARDQVLQLDERTGLHPALAPLMSFWQARELAIVQGLGYPAPNLSHFRSIEIWDTASRSDQYLEDGWLGRALGASPAPASFAADGVAVGGNDLGPLAGIRARTLALADTDRFLRQARLAGSPSTAAPNAALRHIHKVEADIANAASRLDSGFPFRTEFPQSPFGSAVRVAAQLAANPAGIAALRLSLGGFDTHQNQPNLHGRLLGELAAGLTALRAALIEARRWDDTLLMTYAEFGRRPQENRSMGTDHGTAAPHFVVGGRVNGGLYGAPPELAALEGGNLRHAVDFRSLYATALERWWGVSASGVLGARYPALASASGTPLLRAG